MTPEQLFHIYNCYLDSTGISTDSRKIWSNCFFVALKGEAFNGNAFARQALEKGAKYALIDDPGLPGDQRLLKVHDSLQVLHNLAALHRSRLKIPVLAITGTNGKTTTKELVTCVLSQKYKVVATEGNLNNHIGVPLTILRINPKDEFAVIEMGANHIGEIRQLCEIARPLFGLITNIGKAHLEGFGGLQGVIRAKSELYNFLEANDGFAFVNSDQELLMDLSSGIQRTLYGSSSLADVQGKLVKEFPQLSVEWNYRTKRGKIDSRLYGSYNFSNILAAVAVGLKFEVEESRIRDSIFAYVPDNMRSQYKKTEKNTLYLDAYNANPSSMAEALKNFALIPGSEKMIILGDMLELGAESEKEHHEILELAASLMFKRVILVGSEFQKAARNFKWLKFNHAEDVVEWLRTNDLTDYAILIKGSRGIHLEKLIPFL